MSGSSTSYGYSPVHRLIEILSIGVLTLVVGLMGSEVHRGLTGPFVGHAWWLVPASALLAYLVADLVSGVVHFLADSFGDEETTFLGPHFIKPFREHHTDPRGITRHDFIETNGNNCIICIPTAVTVYWYLPAQAELWALFLLSFTAWFMVGIFMTNQFHKWAHLEAPPPWIARLQAWRLILSPDHHDIHHTPPFDRYYCITSGWLNPILFRVRFFPAAEAVLRWVTRSPAPPRLPDPQREPGNLTRSGASS